ncbi:MAG TPA: NAD-dependent epimerase/dehydratase family protein [Myxococcaceae bacterium]|nr:NAD-dependent epimerase/dehydratase family protein [Myxococcaceae bacterium]
MEVLITGANGFLGSALSRRLLGEGHRVRALVRPGSDASALDGVGVERMSGDVTDASSVRRAVEGTEVVFHLAGLRRAPERSAFFRVNAEGTRTVCDAMLRVGARRMVLAGSLAAVGPSRADRPHVETDPFAPEEWYGESKAEAERIALGTAGLEVTVARPPRILGPGDRENLVFFRLVKRGIRLEVGGGPRPLSVVDVDDVVGLLLLLAVRPEAVGETFFSPGPDETTLEEIQTLGAEVLGVRPRTLRLSPGRLRALAAMADGFSQLTGRHLPLNRKLARQLLAPAWTCSGEKARARLGWIPRIDARTSIARSAAWYQAHDWL